MRTTIITAAALAMTASLTGLAFAADSDGRSTEHSSVVSPISHPASTPLSRISTAGGHDVGDDHGGAQGADDRIAFTATAVGDGRHGADDPVGHDVGDDHGGGGHGADDGVGHDVGDDHGSGGHGADG